MDCEGSSTPVSVNVVSMNGADVLVSDDSLDFEQFTGAECNVTVTDTAANTASVFVELTVSDVNEVPSFTADL